MSEGSGGQHEQPTAEPGDGAPEPAVVEQYARGGAWVVVARGEYDLDSLALLADALRGAAHKLPLVVLDASRVTFANSTFLNLLLRIHRETSLRIAAPSLQVRRVLEITEADTVLIVRETVDDAVSA